MRHFERLQSFLVNMEVICGGETDKHSLMIEPYCSEQYQLGRCHNEGRNIWTNPSDINLFTN